ncbi:hypothetical protein [Ruegeria lacuscaerulensis]|uniref:hypothetical protein n=1 Tax=Ruegeria lacuscaerulensis TaxID=55218 RepID=UPI00147A5AC9|nr:hypothetical protein [Ruegeria lacuscaerulensis]
MIEILAGMEALFVLPVLCVTTLYSIKFQYADELAMDMALGAFPDEVLDQLGWGALTDLIAASRVSGNPTRRKSTRLRVLFWGLPALKGLDRPTLTAARRYRLNNLAIFLSVFLIASVWSFWLAGLLVLFAVVTFVRTPNWPAVKGLAT